MAEQRNTNRRLKKSRLRTLEKLESRNLLAAAIWNNVAQPLNVSGDSTQMVSPIDALLVVNELNSRKYSQQYGVLNKQISTGSSVPFLDVSCDGRVSPLDALLVINYLNSPLRGQGAPPPSNIGIYKALACSPQLAEGSGLTDELTKELTAPYDNAAVRVVIQQPNFDRSLPSTVRDAFEIVVQSADQAYVLPYRANGSAAFNWSEGLDPVFASEVQSNESELGDIAIRVPLVGIAEGERFSITLRLVNNDFDNSSSVLFRGFEFEKLTAPIIPNVLHEVSPQRFEFDTAMLEHLSSEVVIEHGRTSFDATTQELSTEVTIRNHSKLPIVGRLVIAVDALDASLAELVEPDGELPDGRPYLDFTAELGGRPLAGGAVSATRIVRFRNAANSLFPVALEPLGLTSNVLGAFSSVANSSVSAGDLYKYTAHISDATESTRYQLIVAPEGMQIDPATGRLTWQTRSSDVGDVSVVIRGEDDAGDYAEQLFTLSVKSNPVASLPVTETNGQDPNTSFDSLQPASTQGHGGGGHGGRQTIGGPGVFYYSVGIAGYISNSNNSRIYADDADIVKLTVLANGTWNHELYFDGSDVGLTTSSEDVDAFAIRADGSIIISTVGYSSVPGLSRNVSGSDLLLFTPTSLGNSTSGSWQLLVDGDDVGLSCFENIDSVSELSDGRLVISTSRTSRVPGISGSFKRQDLVALTLTSTGSNTVGTWEFFLDGSDIGLNSSSEDINGVSVEPNGTTIHLSSLGRVKVSPHLVGYSRDILTYEATQLGRNTRGAFRPALTMNGSETGLRYHWIDAIHVQETASNPNQPPTITPITNRAIDEQASLAVQFVASDPDTPTAELVWSLTSGPAGVTINPQTGRLNWTPTEADGPGTYSVTASVSDGQLSDSESFTISVNEVNLAPTITAIPDQTIPEQTLFQYQVVASDPDIPLNTLTYTLEGAVPAGISISPSGLISWTPTETQGPATYNLTVRATDNGTPAGLFATEAFQVLVNGLMLAEEDRFATELRRTIVLPDSASAIRVTFQAPEFDTTAQRAIRDAFEMEITDSAGNPLSLPYATGRDVVYNWSDGLQPVFGVSTTATTNPPRQDSTATINLTGLPAGTEVILTARLVNNDFDTGTIVRISAIDVVPASGPAPSGFTPSASVFRTLSPVELSRFADITSSFTTSYGRTTLVGDNRELAAELVITNNSNQAITGRILVAIDNFSEPNVHAIRPDGFLADGRPYFDLTAEMQGGALQPGETLAAREIRFLNNSGLQFDYRLSVYGETNAAPTGFVSTSLAEIEAVREYRYQAQAVDPEGQVLAYSVVVGPESLAIDAATGLVTWSTTTGDLGRRQVILRATDPYGLFVEQSFDIQVFVSLQNRPPVFVSTPETEAIAGSGFEVSTVQTGGNPVGVAVANIGLDDGTLVTINRGNQTLSQITALGNDRYELPLELTVGEPGPVDQILRSGYNIDVSLPPFFQQFDSNSIRGMDQADLNGDGLLDIVITALVESRISSTVYTQLVNVMFGIGDGKFSEAVNLASIPTTSSSNPRTLRVADFDQNGTLDILALNLRVSSADPSPALLLLRGAGDGSFSPVEIMPIATILNDFKSVDLNRDGVLDLIGATSDTRSLGYMLGNGDGSFAPFVATFTSTSRIFDASFPGRNYAAGDMDGDGDIDLVFTNFTGGTINVLANDGNLNFTSAASFVSRQPFGNAGAASIYSVFVGDFNGDALIDIAYGAAGYTSDVTGSLGVFVRDSSGFTFTYQAAADGIAYRPGNWAGNSEPIDIDGDGDLDLLLAGVTTSELGNGSSVLRNRGDGTFESNNISLPFTDKSPYEISGSTEGDTKGILAGDYNGDGMLDLVAFKSTQSVSSSSYYSTVSVILADRPGEFATSDILRYTNATNTYQEFFETGDFNNDGIVDLWSATYQAPSRTWLGLGDGSFAAPIIATPNLASGFISKGFVGDFDQDGNLDVFWLGRGGVQNGRDAKFVAALGNGDGTFRITYNPLSSTTRVAPGDFNGDGYLDFVARKNNVSVDIYLYDVANPGTWQPATSFLLSSLGSSVGDYRYTLTVDDFNQDGDLDVATVYRLSGGDVQLVVLPGVGDGTFATPISNPYGVTIPSYSSPTELASGDVNADEIADLVAYDSSAIGVYLGVGDGTFGTPTVIPAADPRQAYGHVFIKDFDYDGHQDILFTDSLGEARLNFLRGNGDGTFEERITYDPAIDAGYVEFGDLDNDGRDEVILSNPDGTDYVTILYAARERLTDIVTADLNGDGNDDVLSTNFDNSRVKWFLGNNLGELVKQPDLLTDNGPVSLVAADFNQDLTNEIITVNRSGRSVSIFSGAVGAYTRTDVAVGRTPIKVTSAFIDTDASRDLLVLDEGLNTVWYLRGNNNLTFSAPVPILLGDRPNDMLAGDVNNDGLTDIVVSLPDSNRLMILSGDGAGNFATPVYVALTASPTAIGISDFNQDGQADLAAAIGDLDAVAILYGRGQLQFAKPQSIQVGDQPVSLKISDADGDGRDDIVVANSGDDTASVIFNRFDPTKVYRYDALAIDPDDDVVAYELVDAPGGLILNAETGQILWAPSAEQIGLRLVTIAASDGRGGISTQSFNIDVVPARENSAPLIGSLPQITIGADEGFTYSVKAADTDNDSLRYRLLDGPDGATIDPISGLVTWDARLNAARLNEFSQVSQHFIVPATAALQPASVTAEGWFKFEGLSSNETLIRKTNGFSGSSYQLSFVGGILRATVGANTSSSGNVFVTYNLNREVGRWYHLAMSFDDVTKQLSLFVDGQQVGTTTANLTIGYNNDTEVFIAGPSTKFNGELGMVRIWNVARPPALLQQSMSSMANSSDPALVLDLDFSSVEAQTMRDKSSYQHVAVRSGTGNIYPKPTSGLAFAQAEPFVVSVEDGRGGYDQQSFQVTYVQPLRGNITGKLFDDQSGDGLQQVGEAGLADWVVYQDLNGNQYPDPQEPSTRTTTTGQYTFGKQLPGTYPVRVQPRSGFETPTETTVNVVANQNTIVDFALNELALGQIRGQVTTGTSSAAARWKVFADLDDNGLLDPTDLFALTDDIGNFAISGLAAGEYRVRAEMLPGWQVTTPANRVLDVTLETNAIAGGNDFVVTAANTTAASGLQFVTTPNLSGASDSIVAGVTYRYDALAIGLLNQTVTYDLSLAPEGMSIDSVTGLVLWRPSLTQVGEQRVILRAMDSQGGVALQDFSLNVSAPNSAPFITSIAPTVGYVGVETRYSIRAQEAENDTLAFNLVSGPATASVDSLTGTLRWIPASGDVGPASFVISVADTSGNVTLQQFAINVSAASPTTTPFTLSPLRTHAAINQAYRSQVDVRDAIGRSLTVTLVSGPTGLTLDSNGNASWVPSTSQLGSQALVVSANDGLGNSQQFTISIAVTQRLVNTAPRITSEPAVYSVANQQYAYDVVAIDAENDELAFELLEAPTGMSINSDSGTLRWLPSRELVGEHAITIQVTDAVGASTLQSYMLRVRSAGGPPQIVSVPPTEAAIGTAWLYSVIATDVEQDPLTYSLLAGPAGVDINTITGELSWTPQSNQLGLNSIAIQVSDGSGGSTSQSFSIRVAAGVPNLPPTISTLPNRFASVGSAYSYLPTATDPEGAPIVYSLSRGPASMTVNPSTGQLNWTPAIGDAGKVIVTLIATDAGGAAAVQSFELDVLVANQTPTIISSPNLSIAAGATWRYSVLGRDADLDPLRYEMLESPAGATINAFGEVLWSTVVADIGSHSFRFRVSDPRGGVIEQSFTLEVVADTVAPRVTVLPDKVNPFPWGGPIHVYVSAVDNVGIASVTMTVNGIDVPLDANRHAVLYVEDWGFAVLNIVATATDTAGNIGTGTGVTFYNDPEVDGDTNAPTATITSPAESASVTGFVDIIGTAAGANVSGYRLLYRRIDQTEASFTQFATGTLAVTNGVLGKWDTSLLNNDEYVIRLEVSNTSGRTNILDRQVGLSGELKLGNFQLSFTDIAIPVAGIPIEITRIYDTLQADRHGDFGYGWRLEYRNTDLRVGLPKSGLEDIGIYTPLRAGVKVYLNVPGQGRQGFTFTPEIRVLPGFGGNNLVLARPRFTPDPGVTSSLSTGISSYLQVNELGELYAPGGIPYNPASLDFGGAYVLTTREGTTYRIDASSGKLNTVTDRNGNKLLFTDAGISNLAGTVDVNILRDTSGRIVSIEDIAGERIVYQYSGGQLSTVTDRMENVTTFNYLGSSPAFLDRVIDPLGREGVRVEYDEFGRLSRSVALNGNTVEFSYDPANFTEILIDSLGKESFLEYDNEGHILSVTDALNRTLRRTYDQYGFLASETDTTGGKTTFKNDSAGRQLQVTDRFGGNTYFQYGVFDTLKLFTDAIGNTIEYQLDNFGNITAIVRADNSTVSYEYDANGNMTLEVDALGNRKQFTYDGEGRRLAVTEPNGVTSTVARNANGAVVSETITLPFLGEDAIATRLIEYDANGNVLSDVDANGSRNRFEYDALNRRVKVVSPNGVETVTQFADSGEIESFVFSDGSMQQYGYNDQGLVGSFLGRGGYATQSKYDLIGQLQSTSTVNPDDPDSEIVRMFETDGLGRLVGYVDPEGNRYSRLYDAFGNNQVIEINPDGSRYTKRFDPVGNLVIEIDAVGNETRHFYNAQRQLIRTVFADNSSFERRYDPNGNLIAMINENGDIRRFEYDSQGNLITVIDSDGGRTEMTYVQYAPERPGQLATRTGPDGLTTRYRFDLAGRFVATELPDGQVIAVSLDADGNVVSTDTIGSQPITVVRNDNGLIVQRELPDGTISTASYTGAGSLELVRDTTGETRFQYDTLERLVRRTEPSGRFVAYTYDSSSRIRTLSTPSGATTYTYDNIGRIQSVSDSSGDIASYLRDANGRVIQAQYPGGIVERIQYDSRGNVASIEQSTSATILAMISYERDFSGRITKITEGDRHRKYEYDASSRLTRDSVFEGGVLAHDINYTYDLSGNRLEKREANSSTIYRYNAAGQLVEAINEGVTTTYSYDVKGSLTQSDNGTELRTYRYDFEGRLISVEITSAAETTIVTYRYGAEGDLVARTINGSETQFLVDRSSEFSRIVEFYDVTTGTTQRPVYGETQIGIVDQNGYQTVLSDASSSNRLFVSPGGQVQSRRDYSAFGEPTFESLSDMVLSAWGELYDPVTGLTYLRSRFLQNETGRFISRDTLIPKPGDVDNANPYVYADNDPVNKQDPSGHFLQLIPLIASTLAVVTGTAAVVIGATNALAAAYSLGIGYQAYKLKDSGREWTGIQESFAVDAILFGVTPQSFKMSTPFGRSLTLSASYTGVDIGVGFGVSFGAGEANVQLFTPREGNPSAYDLTGHLSHGGLGGGVSAANTSIGTLQLGDGVGWYYSYASIPDELSDLLFGGAAVDTGAHGAVFLDRESLIPRT